ncbi:MULTISPECIES: hypothetical protein [unclassified Treponema]|uniref:hypothetical protein n=1 Tax=unclassified Treponema TaxID=2638727 RepID=UPI0020A43E50|nr:MULTISPECIES: hypothetical protein [unclassified Treponema]UTC67281.1 hypothetical protein E4O06_00990 [Treponema sp. OMZ 789]UTC70009.1 hypothetical protein E4O01_00985 [Treponema sp. OMZ 790]UTC72724.1 hypothetical protein E4O02_00985 [Treponema sp. OMZ 791]
MKTVKLFSLFLILLSLLAVMAGCASMYIHGSTPVQRAISAADLLIAGNISDDYIRVYKKESAQAEQSIMDMISKAERYEIYYADVADNISDWMLLYVRVTTLQRMYPEGLWGKREFAVFEARDYSNLKDKAYTKATEALYDEALHIARTSGNDSKSISKALANLKRAKKYSRHLDNEINSLGADIAYNAAESLSYTNRPDNLLQASEYYMLAHSWIPGYKEALEKSRFAKEKAAYLYIEEGRQNLRLKDYTAFRHAKKAFQKAEKIIPGIASREIAEVNRRLTVRLVIVMPENTYNQNEEDRVRRAISSELASAKSGPEIVEINFTRGGMSSIFNLIDIRDADLVLTPSDNYGKVKESYGPVNTSNKNVSKVINGIVYTGMITEQSQVVTVYAQNDFVLYDIRTWRKNELRYFSNTANKLSKTFTMRYYSGAPEAKPADFDPGFLYEAGQYRRFFPELMQSGNSMHLLTNYWSLNQAGKELCNAIQNLEYVERRLK